MAENKTRATGASVAAFLAAVEPAMRREDAKTVCELMARVTGEPAVMWGTSIVGFGRYHYKYESGREGDFMIAGFSPRKSALVLYIMAGFSEYEALLAKLGKHKTGKSCLYVNRLADVDMKILERLVRASVKYMRAKYGV